MSKLYPLKFRPIFKEKLWGGQKMKTILGKACGHLNKCGESWELSGVKGNISVIANGPLAGQDLTSLLKERKGDLVGGRIYKQFGNQFPLLIKFIDAAQDLSIQVHPNDELAKKRHNCPGKSEMWYILQADSEATLINGFKRNTNKEEYQQLLNKGALLDLLYTEAVSEGDVFYLPSGRVHTIGKGILIAEIQEPSDITYRIYDFDREDQNGQKRELHTELAIEAINYNKPNEVKSKYDDSPNQTNTTVESPHFTTNKLRIDRSMEVNRSELDCFKIYIGIGGKGRIANEKMKLGEVMIVPANYKEYTIEPDEELELLETYIG